MALEPGKLDDLGDAGRQDWSNELRAAHEGHIASSGTRCFLAEADADITSTVVPVDWGGFPIHVQLCLQSEDRANRLLDWTTSLGDQGRMVGHEEYMEWRAVRSPAGKLIRVEITSELSDYWLKLARHNPARVLRLAARFAGEAQVDPRDIYGTTNPFAADVTLDRREEAFRRMMLPLGSRPPRSPYNNGQKAICFMYNGINTMPAAVGLAAFAAHPLGKRVGADDVPLSGREAINSTAQAAADCRNSDPTIVGGVLGAAWDRRKIVFDDPFGVYISTVNHAGVLLPDGVTPIPKEWFILERGTAGTDPVTDPDRFQRLTLEVPLDESFVLGDLIDAGTGGTIDFGAQIARLVTVNFLVRLSEADKVDQPRSIVNVAALPDCGTDGCSAFKQAFEELEGSLESPEGLEAARVRPRYSRRGREA